jgi:hypothetical protein
LLCSAYEVLSIYLVEPAFEGLPKLNIDEYAEDKQEYVQQLQDALHLKEAGIEIEEQWILKIEVD